jgi:hypothetical protein
MEFWIIQILYISMRLKWRFLKTKDGAASLLRLEFVGFHLVAFC